MTTEVQKSELLEDFRLYLEESKIEPFMTQSQPDLHTLLSELTALKTEVKAESRQFKNTLDTLSSALSLSQKDHADLIAEFANHEQRMQHHQHKLIKTLLLQIIEIYDRVSSGIDVLENYRPVQSFFKSSRKKDISFIEHFKQGQEMTIRRFDQFFQHYHVSKIDCEGLLLNPNIMKAVETGYDLKLDDGIVMEELRKGYMYKDNVLRLAEVKVNKNEVLND